MIKKIMPLLLVSVFVQANEIDNLILTSNSIKQTFDLGIRTVAGQSDYAQIGGISADMASDAYLTYDQADAYNVALSDMQTANYQMTAQEYFDEQSNIALDNLSTAISTYVDASTQLVSAVQINEMASNADTSDKVVEIQTYIENNDLTITNENVDTYNESLDMVQDAAQTAAAFIAIASDQTLIDSAQAQADELNQSFSFAETAFYNQGNFNVTLQGGDISLDVTGYLKSATEVLAMGQESTFYTTSPTGSDCFFNQNNCVE